MVAFDNITANARLLCDLLDCDIDIRTVDDGPEAEAILAGMQQDRCEAILCDAVSNAAAKRLGFNSFLITSGPDSIRQAFEQALFLCRSQTRLREENLFFRELLHGQIGQTIVLDDNGISTCPRWTPAPGTSGPSEAGAARIPERGRAEDHPESGRHALFHPVPARNLGQSLPHSFSSPHANPPCLPTRRASGFPQGRRLKPPFTAAFSALRGPSAIFRMTSTASAAAVHP